MRRLIIVLVLLAFLAGAVFFLFEAALGVAQYVSRTPTTSGFPLRDETEKLSPEEKDRQAAAIKAEFVSCCKQEVRHVLQDSHEDSGFSPEEIADLNAAVDENEIHYRSCVGILALYEARFSFAESWDSTAKNNPIWDILHDWDEVGFIGINDAGSSEITADFVQCLPPHDSEATPEP